MGEKKLLKMCNTCIHFEECKTLGINLGFGICQVKEETVSYNNIVTNDDYICSKYEPKEEYII